MADTSTARDRVAARALMAAFHAAHDGIYEDGEWIPNRAAQVAAVLRALSVRIVGDPRVRTYLLGVAAELEGKADG